MSDSKTTIFVGGLDDQVTSQTLHDAFLPFGDILDVSLPKPELKSNTSPHRGFAYISFADPSDAREAIDNMHLAELYGRVLKVNEAKPQKHESEKLGSRTAVWEQEGYAAKYNVDSQDLEAAEGSGVGQQQGGAMDPMQGLEGLDVAGPKAQ